MNDYIINLIKEKNNPYTKLDRVIILNEKIESYYQGEKDTEDKILNITNIVFYNLSSYINNAMIEDFDNDDVLNIIEDYKKELTSKIKELSNSEVKG